ncbi:hypothetical protein NADFUDRAFT_83260 [Nadsonia fulvescens var. elongata DSM 6958]|uniref:Uncharacterized protein n=1 Tax=Nadsonia fulvescens var. elongata DSM 6958 TaxID=857566 RepID=A0A1E3PJ38_9ASCO|nr:hypothetical protein NADFUDRAFT_83260 [Nadsonia fulvescens var. elongata DSM 6958]
MRLIKTIILPLKLQVTRLFFLVMFLVSFTWIGFCLFLKISNKLNSFKDQARLHQSLSLAKLVIIQKDLSKTELNAANVFGAYQTSENSLACYWLLFTIDHHNLISESVMVIFLLHTGGDN